VLIFDLDGTLVDSRKDLSSSVNHVRKSFGLSPLSEDAISGYIGDGAQMLIQRALGPDAQEPDVHSGLQLFLAYYREHMLDESVLYPGVSETLARLSDCRMAVLTNKPVRFSRMMLEGLGILHHFAAVYGGNSFERKKPDPVGVFQILSDTSGRIENTWMIGDSAVDVLTGRNAGAATCGVSWGYAAESFRQTPPHFVIHRFEELEALVRGRDLYDPLPPSAAVPLKGGQ
jgi:phosphoglycolate phosphatase